MKLRAGKYYRRLDGDVVGPIRMVEPKYIDENSIFKFVFGDNLYKEDGKFLAGEREHPWDLVNEVEVKDV